MDQRTEVVFIAIAFALLASIMTWLFFRYRRSKELRERFGPEYDRVVRKEGNVKRGEGVLAFREKKREGLQIHPLSSASRLEFSDRWNAVQAQFVDDPGGSVAKANSLVNQLMEARGFPMADFEERADIISVDHPHVVENYRAAHSIALSRTLGQTTTEALRKAMVYYRSLFDELLHETYVERKEARA
jgi:hypothetical protein